MSNREICLKKAMEIVTGDREKDYGTPEDNFKMIAYLWSDYLEADISAVDVAMMMSLLKIARISSGNFTEDSFIDLAGYAACGFEIAFRNDAKVDDALMKATLSEYAPIEELARYMGVRD